MLSGFFFATPPTAQTEHSRELKFGMKGPQAKLSGMTKAILVMSPLSWDIGVGRPTPGVGKNRKFFFFKYQIFLTESTFLRSVLAKKAPICLILTFFGCILMFSSGYLFCQQLKNINIHPKNVKIRHMGTFSASTDLKEVDSIKKIWYLRKKFFPIFSTPGVGQPTPISQLRGNIAKIALVIPDNFAWGPFMPNLSSLICSVWAVGGVAKKNLLNIF